MRRIDKKSMAELGLRSLAFVEMPHQYVPEPPFPALFRRLGIYEGGIGLRRFKRLWVEHPKCDDEPIVLQMRIVGSESALQQQMVVVRGGRINAQCINTSRI